MPTIADLTRDRFLHRRGLWPADRCCCTPRCTTAPISRPVHDALANGRRALALDWPGHGDSPLPAVPLRAAQFGDLAVEFADLLESAQRRCRRQFGRRLRGLPVGARAPGAGRRPGPRQHRRLHAAQCVHSVGLRRHGKAHRGEGGVPGVSPRLHAGEENATDNADRCPGGGAGRRRPKVRAPPPRYGRASPSRAMTCGREPRRSRHPC